MKFHPILFSTEMVIAILERRKKQTRRVIKPQPEMSVMGRPVFEAFKIFNGSQADPSSMTYKGCRYTPWPQSFIDICCPYGQVGDVLWVQETFKPSVFAGAPVGEFEYMADHVKWPDSIGEKYVKGSGLEKGEHWRPSIHMPKSACRIFLQITDIRVERLQDISEEDAIAEGIKQNGEQDRDEWFHYMRGFDDFPAFSPQESYFSLWEKINGKESLNSNPWVWCLTFKRVDKPSIF